MCVRVRGPGGHGRGRATGAEGGGGGGSAPGAGAGEGGGSGSSAGAALTGPSPREGRRWQLGPARAETHREHRLGHRLPPPRPPPPLQLHPGNSGDAALGQRRLFPALSDALRPLCPLCSRATLPSVNIGCVRRARRPSVPPFGKHRLPPPSTTPFSPSLRKTSASSVTLGPPCPSRLGPLLRALPVFGKHRVFPERRFRAAVRAAPRSEALGYFRDPSRAGAVVGGRTGPASREQCGLAGRAALSVRRNRDPARQVGVTGGISGGS